MIAYFDTSALIKLVIPEDDSAIAREIWNTADLVATSWISYLETRAGLARAARQNPPRLTAAEFLSARRTIDDLWPQISTVAVSEGLLRKASEVAEAHNLRAYDAMQFASAVDLSEPDVVLVTRDQELEQAARAVGMNLSHLSPPPAVP